MRVTHPAIFSPSGCVQKPTKHRHKEGEGCVGDNRKEKRNKILAMKVLSKIHPTMWGKTE